MNSKPQNEHDFAKWLLAVLEQQAPHGEAGVQGHVPQSIAWSLIEEAQEEWERLFGWCSQAERTVEFFPERAGVFQSLQALLRVPQRQREAPARFSLLAEGYDSASGQAPPAEVARYLQAVKFAGALKQAADVVDPLDGRLLFIKSHEIRITVKVTYTQGDLADVPGMDDWIRDFVTEPLHREQKRILLRQTLLDLFRGHAEVTLGQLLSRFSEIDQGLRASYALYMSDFTLEKVKSEVEKDNLDSSLKIGKAVSDIQNQLLGMPLALLLAGGQMAVDAPAKNAVLMLGAIAFAWLMNMLILNQRATLQSVALEVDARQQKINAQPAEVSRQFQDSFNDLQERVQQQHNTLRKVEWLVAACLLVTHMAFLWLSMPRIF